MPPILALTLCTGLVIALLLIERKQNPKASLALWIPTIWMLICASRPIGYWFGAGLEYSLEEGNPYDRIVAIILIFLSTVIVFKRNIEWGILIKYNLHLVFLYLFLGVSILWSDYEYVSFKRWIRLLGGIPVAMVVLSEKSPYDAMESVFRRCAYILIPISLVLIKYYPENGVLYGRWSGLPSWTGVTITKNGLGQLCAFSSFFIIWVYIRNWQNKLTNIDYMEKVADALVLGIALFMLAGIGGSFSATSTSVMAVGVASMFALYRTKHSRNNLAKIFMVGIMIIWLMLIYSETFIPAIATILKRDETLTGRTEIWQVAFEAAERNPLLGAGFGGYWVTGNEISAKFGGMITAHNGLLDAYLEIGIVGVILLLWFHFGLYNRLCRALKGETDWSIFGISFLLMSMLFNYTESIFLKSSLYIWNITIFIAVILGVTNRRGVILRAVGSNKQENNINNKHNL